MITLYGFGPIFAEGRGETKDLWVQWALEELGLPYRVHALDHTGGELDREPFSGISPFHQAPVIDDDGFIVAESAAICLYLAEKAGKLVPADVQGRIRVTQWCFAATATVGATLMSLDIMGMFDPEMTAARLRTETDAIARRWLGHLERRLAGRDWIACADFTVADVMLTGELRTQRKSGLLDDFPKVRAYYERCTARAAYQRALAACAERVGVTVDAIR